MGTGGPCLGMFRLGARQRWTEPSPWSWNNQGFSDEENFAHLTDESSDGSESNCGPFWAPKPVDSNNIPVDTFKHTDDGWCSYCDPQPRRHHLGNRIQIPSHREARTHSEEMSSRLNELDTNMPVIVEPLAVPSSSEHVHRWKELYLMLFILCSTALPPERITLPRSDDAIFSGYDEYFSSKRDGFALWGLTDLSFARLLHLVTSGSAKPVFRSAHARRHSSPKPENRPNRSLEQTRLSKLSWNLGARRGREKVHCGKMARDCSSRID